MFLPTPPRDRLGAACYYTGMSKQTYFYVAAGVFIVAGGLHLVRALSGWDLIIAGVEIPVWVSWAAVILGGYLAYRGYHFGRRM